MARPMWPIARSDAIWRRPKLSRSSVCAARPTESIKSRAVQAAGHADWELAADVSSMLRATVALGPYSLLVYGSSRWGQADQRQVRDCAGPADVPRCVPQAPLRCTSGRLLRMEGDQGSEGKAALRDSDEGWRALRHRRHLGELEGACFG